MSISDKLLEFTRSLDEVDQSDKDYYSQLDMADKMAMGMGGLGTLYGSAAEQAGLPVQDWSKKNLSPEAMNQAGIALSNTAANWTPEQAQVFEGIQNIPSQMIQPVQQPQMPQQPLTQTQQNVIAGENSMNRMQQEVDYAKSQQAAQVKNQAAQQVQNKAGIAALSDEDLQIAKEETRGLVQQAVIDQTDDIDDTTQAAKETQGWSEEHFRGAIKAIDILLQKTNPQSAEYMSLQNRKADLIRVYESQKGSDDPYRAMEGQIATNQSQAQQKDETAQMQLLADEQQATVAQAVDEQDTLNMLSDWDADTQMSGIDDAYADLDAGYAKRAADKEQERQQYSRDIAQGFKSNDARNMAADFKAKDEDELDTRQMLADWDAETADDAAMGNIDDIYANLDADYATRQQEKANAEADYLNDPQGDETKSLVATIATEEKEAWEKGQVTANEAYQRIINDADQAYEDELAGEDAKIAEFNANLEGVVEEVASSGDENAVAGITKLKKEMSNSVVNSDGTMKSSAEIRSMTAKLLKEALAIENKKNVDRDWGPAMMQFGLTLMSTPGNLLTGIGIAGKDALKMWQDIKKGDKDSVTAKRELALKYAELADTKDKATLDSKEKMYTKWEVNKDGTISTSQVVGKKTGKERAGKRLNEMSALSTKGVLDRLTQKQAAQFANDYISAYNSSNTINRFGEVQNDTGKENPLVVLSKLRKKYPNDKELSNIEFALRSNRPPTVVQSETKAKKTSYNGLMTSYRSLIKTIEESPDNSTTWLGNLTSSFSKLVSPRWNSNANVGDNATSIKKAFEETFASSFTETVRKNNEIKGLIRTLARQRLMARHGEKGKSISNEDMRDEVRNIAALGDWGADKSTIINQLQSARKSDLEVYGSEWESAFENRDNFLRGFTGKNKAIAYNLAFGEGRDEAEGGSTSTQSTTGGSKETTLEQVSHYLPAVHKEVAKLIALHGEGSDGVALGMQKYLQGKGLSESQITAIFKYLATPTAQK